MILLFILGIATTAIEAANSPLTDLSPPDFPNSQSQTYPGPPDDAGLRGLYVPDNLEKRFDDGSDKSPPAPVPLADSPYGPVPAGSGLEGQYVQENIEKMYDPGLYVPDNIEKQFDQGLYKDDNTPEPVLVQSPYGLVRAGSGIEGQYVDSEIEKQFDGGQYVDTKLEKRFDDGLYKGDTSPQPNLMKTQLGLVSAGTGLEGQYFPDGREKQFDDGLERSGALYSAGNTNNGVPQGLVPSGVGLLPSK